MTLCVGMSGAYVRDVQQLLSSLSLYRGAIDSSYGEGTYSAVQKFQIRHGLPPSGMVDGATWAAMFPGIAPPLSDLLTRPLSSRCLALTGSFETSTYPPDSFCGLCGDFDQMGISFGVCQWNIGQGTLQPLLERMFQDYPRIARAIFAENFETLASLGAAEITDQLAFARSIQEEGQIIEPWRDMFLSLGRTPEFQDIQTDAASESFQFGLELCRRFGLTSERAAALMFDIITQNGSIDAAANAAIHKAVEQLSAGADTEVTRMTIIANQIADVSAPDYAADVRTRKLAVAEGEGTVHGRYYNLADMFGIGLSSFDS